MVRRNKLTFSASALLALSLTAGPMAVSSAVAQEGMMLETFGAVRMASPQEIQQMNEEAARQQQAEQARSVALSQQHAGLAD